MLVDILINASPDGDADPAVNSGLSLAKSLNAHATGVVLGVEPIMPVTYFAAAPVELVNKLRGAAEEAANAAAARFTKAANAAGVDSDSFAFTSTLEGALRTFAELTRIHDLTVVNQPNPDRPGPEREVIKTALFDSGRAVLIVPYIQKAPIELNRVMIAWDGGRAATRAVSEARPLLARAKQIEILVVETDRPDPRELPGAGLAKHLARHRLNVEIRRTIAPSARDVDSTILNAITEGGIDLVVMGGFGHSRLRDFVFGGATNGVIESMTAPVLMAN